MNFSELAPVVIAFMAVAAFLLSIYNTVVQRRDARKQEERWRKEKLPNLTVESDDRVGYGLPVHIYSLRIVNSGGVPVEIRSLRIALPDGRYLTLPEADDETRSHMWESETPIGEGLPYALIPGHSVRFATRKDDMEVALRRAGLTDHVDYAVEVEDALGNTYRSEEWAMLGRPHPQP
jgi:hypothetical protein